jgi:hypothetical protein
MPAVAEYWLRFGADSMLRDPWAFRLIASDVYLWKNPAAVKRSHHIQTDVIFPGADNSRRVRRGRLNCKESTDRHPTKE